MVTSCFHGNAMRSDCGLFNNYSPKTIEVIIGEYSPRRSRGEYSPIITEPDANNCFSIFTQVFCVFLD
jgi:hypothetical protein